MSRPSTAVREWPSQGRPGMPVTLHQPGAAGGGPKRSWRVKYYDPDGVRRETTAVGREAAVAKAEALAVSLAASVLAPSATSPMSVVLETYMTRFAARKHWAAKYRYERAQTVRWLPDWFLRLQAGGWRVQHTEDVLLAVAAAGYPLGCQEYRRAGAFLSGLRTTAREYGYLPPGHDPMVGVAYNPPSTRPQGRPDEPRDRYSAVRPVPPAAVPGDDAIEEFAEVVAWLTGDWREALRVRFLRASGLRWGEHADLRVGRVSLDPDLPSVHVCTQAVEIPRRYGDGGPTLRLGQPPKGGRSRHAFYDHDMVADDLERLVAGIRRDRRLTGRPEDALLFPAPRGGAVRAGTHSSRVWGPAAAACGWQRVEDQPTAAGAKRRGWVWTPHSLRHRYATFLVREAKADLFDVSEWMGHSDTEITRKMYVDLTEPNVGGGVAAVRRLRDAQRSA